MGPKLTPKRRASAPKRKESPGGSRAIKRNPTENGVTRKIVPHPSPPLVPITAELLELWQSMTDEARRDLLSVARGLAQAEIRKERCPVF